MTQGLNEDCLDEHFRQDCCGPTRILYKTLLSLSLSLDVGISVQRLQRGVHCSRSLTCVSMLCYELDK